MNELVAYKSNLCSLKNLLGLGCFHILEKEEILPYTSRIIEVLNTRLTLEDKDEVKENVKLFIEYYTDGLSKMTEANRMNEILEDYGYTRGELGFVIRYFVMAWTNVFSTIYLELLYNYPEFFTTSPIDCHECCGVISEEDLTYQTSLGLSIPCGCH